MKIDCYISKTCSSEDALRKNVFDAINLEGIDASVNIYRITDEEARSLGLMGSPTVLIDGEDILSGEIPGFA
jgi:hypothetical protein